MTPSDRHNAALVPVMRLIIRLVGTDSRDLLVFAESIVVGLFLVIVRLGGDEPVLAIFADGVRERLAQQRLGDIPTQGEA